MIPSNLDLKKVKTSILDEKYLKNFTQLTLNMPPRVDILGFPLEAPSVLQLIQ